jgi:NAD(P)-dependent dehydrogenase (short-subunit alcohol dehydrogenase family)
MGVYSATEDVPDLTGKVIIVTGANGGLGYEATRAFLRKGATVVMACRNPQRAQDALEQLARDESLPADATTNAHFMRLDLADQASIKQFVAEFLASFDQLHVLLNNAGLIVHEKTLTVDGFEMTMGVNHVSLFLCMIAGHVLPSTSIHFLIATIS